MTDQDTIELNERQRNTFEVVRDDISEPQTPEPSDQQVMDALLDTWVLHPELHPEDEQ